MDWKQGYTSVWRLFHVNKDTWGDSEEIFDLNSASVTKDADSDLIEDGSISVDGDRINGYVRLYMDVVAGAEATRMAIGTFLVITPTKNIKGRLISTDVTCYSVLKPASDRLMETGWYFPKGGDPIVGAYNLLSECLQCPVEYSESDIRTDEVKVAESGETYLSMALYLLEDTGYCIQIDGTGKVTIEKEPSNYAFTFDTKENDYLESEITDETDIYDIPNVLLVTDSDGNSETIRNDEEDSETSTVSLGWEKWSSEQLDLDSGESLLSKGAEKLEELSKRTRTISYSRDYIPGLRIHDLVRFMLPEQGIVGIFRIKSQSIEAGAGALVSEVATLESYDWRA